MEKPSTIALARRPSRSVRTKNADRASPPRRPRRTEDPLSTGEPPRLRTRQVILAAEIIAAVAIKISWRRHRMAVRPLSKINVRLRLDQSILIFNGVRMSLTQNLNFIQEYWIDAWQRSILTLDVLRERGNICLEHNAQNAPQRAELRVRARPRRPHPAERPVNYVLVRIVPPDGQAGRSGQAAVHRRRPARRPWARHRRHEAGQRDRRCAWRPAIPATSSASCPQPDAGPDDRGRVRGRSVVRRRGRGAPSRGRRQAGHHRQLPGRLAGHDDGGDPARPRRSDPAGGLAALLLGGRARHATRCAISAACWAAPG